MIIRNPKVGQHVYQPYAPAKAGIIVEVLPSVRTNQPMYPRQPIRVKWLDGVTTTVQDSSNLKDFDALIADHEKKLATHRAVHARLKELEIKL